MLIQTKNDIKFEDLYELEILNFILQTFYNTYETFNQEDIIYLIDSNKKEKFKIQKRSLWGELFKK